MSPAKSDDSLLKDMLSYSKEAREFTSSVSYESFVKDRKLRYATERCLEIVGEVASRLSPPFKDAHPEIPWHRLRGLRNVLAHDYGEIAEEVIYQCATLDVPDLIAQLERLVSTMPPDGVREDRAEYRWRELIAA